MELSETAGRHFPTFIRMATWIRGGTALYFRRVWSSDNTVTRLLVRRTRRDFLFPVAASAALFLGIGLIYLSYGVQIVSWVLTVLLCAVGLPLVHIACSMRVFAFRRSLRRSGRAADWLAAPLERREFGDAFQRVFWSSTLWCTCVAFAAIGLAAFMTGDWPFGRVSPGEAVWQFFWSGVILIILQWMVFWGFVHSVLAGLLAPVFCAGSFIFSAAVIVGGNPSPLGIAFLALFIFGGTGYVLSRDCYLNYRDRLREKLFP